jgi:hypothetical protein
VDYHSRRNRQGGSCGIRVTAQIVRNVSVYQGKTLVVILCMHRCGSSLVANVLQRLGMTLGPFELLGATEHNKYGHFEAVPFFHLDQQVLAQVFGFQDFPESAEAFRRFSERRGRWRLKTSPVTEEMLQRGRDLVEQLVGSGQVSGFKDPRVPLLWPFWSRVFAGFPGLRVVPLFLVRSPHEVAMSLFTRSRGDMAYRDALDLTAIHYRRLHDIRDRWDGERAMVRFDPRVFARDLRRAAEICRLDWSDALFSQVYDASCRHHEPAVVAHEAQRRFQRMGRLPAKEPAVADLRRLEEDAAAREGLVRSRFLEMQQQVRQFTLQAEQYRQEIAALSAKLDEQQRESARQREEIDRQMRELAAHCAEIEAHRKQSAQCRQELAACTAENAQCRQELAACTAALEQRHAENTQYRREIETFAARLAEQQRQNARCRELEQEHRQRAADVQGQLALVTGTRTWRWHQRMVGIPPVRWLWSMRPRLLLAARSKATPANHI